MPKRKIYLISKVKQPVFDVIVLMLTIAILDDAFLLNIRSVEDIFKTRVSLPRRSLKLDFKKDKLNVPICR
jgi:hypothetical protein